MWSQPGAYIEARATLFLFFPDACFGNIIYKSGPGHASATEMSVDLFGLLVNDLLKDILMLVEAPRLVEVSEERSDLVKTVLNLYEDQTVQGVLSLTPDFFRAVCRRFRTLTALPQYRARELETRDVFFAQCAESFMKRLAKSCYWRHQRWVVLWGGREILMVSLLREVISGENGLCVSVSICDDGPLFSIDLKERTEVSMRFRVPILEAPEKVNYFHFESPFSGIEQSAVNKWLARLERDRALHRSIAYCFKIARLHRAQGRTREDYVVYDSF